MLLASSEPPGIATSPVFSAPGHPLTRFGIYKVVRRRRNSLDDFRTQGRISPHIFTKSRRNFYPAHGTLPRIPGSFMRRYAFVKP